MTFAEFGSGQAFFSLFYFFMFIIWFWLLITVFSDLFRDHQLNGWVKAIWVIFVIILPYLGVLVYLIARGHGMAKRAAAAQAHAQSEFDSAVRQAAGKSGSQSPSEQIAHAKELLDAGTINQQEFDALKAKALA